MVDLFFGDKNLSPISGEFVHPFQRVIAILSSTADDEHSFVVLRSFVLEPQESLIALSSTRARCHEIPPREAPDSRLALTHHVGGIDREQNAISQQIHGSSQLFTLSSVFFCPAPLSFSPRDTQLFHFGAASRVNEAAETPFLRRECVVGDKKRVDNRVQR